MLPLAFILANSPHLLPIYRSFVPASPAAVPPPQANSSRAPTSKHRIYIGVPKGMDESLIRRIEQCFKEKNIPTQCADPQSATHYVILFTRDSLKDKDYMLPLMTLLDDPFFKQRIFPVNTDPDPRTMPLYGAGDDTEYSKFWGEQQHTGFHEIKIIQERVGTFVRLLREILVKDTIEALLEKKLAPIMDTIEQRDSRLQKKPFSFLPYDGSLDFMGRDDVLNELSSRFRTQSVVNISGEPGVGKTALAKEYALRYSEKYPSGVFWLNAKDEHSTQESYERLATQLGMSVEKAKRQLTQTVNCLLIFDNVSQTTIIPSYPNAHVICIGSDLPNSIQLNNFSSNEAKAYVAKQLGISEEDAEILVFLLGTHPGILSGAVEYIRSRKISFLTYCWLFKKDFNNLMKSQKAVLEANQSYSVSKLSSSSIRFPSSETIAKFAKQPVTQLAQQLKDLGIQVFISYNWGAKPDVEQVDGALTKMGIRILRDDGILKNFDSLKEFMKKVIKKADYTLCVMSEKYLKSFNCLYEIVKTMEDPYWKNRVFPIVISGTNLDDDAIRSYQQFWSKEAQKLSDRKGSTEQIAVMEEGAGQIGSFLNFVKHNQVDPFEIQHQRQYQALMAQMLARQEVLEKKGPYKEGIFHLPLGQNKHFRGRSDDLDKLEKSLKKDQFSKVAITGIAGVGKTQLAVEYAYRYQSQYNMIYWIRAENRESIMSDLRMLGLEMGISEEALKGEKVIPVMKDVLQKQKGWLLIFDNAEGPTIIDEMAPQSGGHIITTSLNPNMQNALPLNVFTEAAACAYLQDICGDSDTLEHYKLLAKELRCLPLAIAQAAAYIKQERIDVTTFLKTFQSIRRTVLSQKVQSYPAIVGTVWQMSMDKIAKKDRNAVQLLNFCSVLAPHPILEDALKGWLKEKNGEESEIKFQDALWLLESYGLIHQVVEDGVSRTKRITLHELIKDATLDSCNVGEAKNTVEVGVKFLDANLQSLFHSPHDLPEEHAKMLLGHAQRLGIQPELIAGLAYHIGMSFHHIRSHLKQAKEFLEKALVGGLDVIKAKAHSELGVVSEELGDFESAKSHFEAAVQWYERTGDLSNLSVCYTRLGQVLNLLNQPTKAKIQFENAFKALLRIKPGDDLTRACLYKDISHVLNDLGRYSEAESYVKQALEIVGQKDEYSGMLPDIYFALGTILYWQEKYLEAASYIEKSIKITEDYLQGDFGINDTHLFTLMGKIKLNLGDLDGAKIYFEKAVQIYLSLLGNENHLDLAQIYECIGDSLKAQNKQTEAQSYYDRAKKIKAVCQGSADPSVDQITHVIFNPKDHEMNKTNNGASEGFNTHACKLIGKQGKYSIAGWHSIGPDLAAALKAKSITISNKELGISQEFSLQDFIKTNYYDNNSDRGNNKFFYGYSVDSFRIEGDFLCIYGNYHFRDRRGDLSKRPYGCVINLKNNKIMGIPKHSGDRFSINYFSVVGNKVALTSLKNPDKTSHVIFTDLREEASTPILFQRPEGSFESVSVNGDRLIIKEKAQTLSFDLTTRQ